MLQGEIKWGEGEL